MEEFKINLKSIPKYLLWSCLDTKLRNFKKIWEKAKEMHEGISEICASPPKIPLLNPEINNRISDSVTSRERLLVNSTIPVAKPVDFSTIKKTIKRVNFIDFLCATFHAQNALIPPFLILLTCTRSISTNFYYLSPTFTIFCQFLTNFYHFPPNCANYYHFY